MREKKFNLENTQKATKKTPKNEETRISAISCYLGYKSMIFQRQKFSLMLFCNGYFNNSLQFLYDNKLISTQNT